MNEYIISVIHKRPRMIIFLDYINDSTVLIQTLSLVLVSVVPSHLALFSK